MARIQKYPEFSVEGEGERRKILTNNTREVKFPLLNVPEDKLIENKFGSYLISFKNISENTFEYKRQFILKKNTFPPEEYENYRNFIKKVAKLDRSKLLLTKTIK